MCVEREMPVTAADMVMELWQRCLTAAREDGHVDASAVQRLIAQSREILGKAGATKRSADGVFFLICTEIHWDGASPVDRVFEQLLDFELTDFNREALEN